MEEELGVLDKVRAALLEAKDADDLKRIRRELVKQGFNRNTVDQAVRRLRKKGYLRFDAKLSPVPRAPSDGFMRMLPTEVVPPEWALQGFKLQDGDYRRGFIDGIGMMLLTARYNQILAASQAEVVKSQLEIYEKARGSVSDIASQAATEAVSGITQWLLKEKPWVISSPNPLQSMMVDLMKPVLMNIVNAFMPKIPGQSISQIPPGFTIEE